MQADGAVSAFSLWASLDPGGGTGDAPEVQRALGLVELGGLLRQSVDLLDVRQTTVGWDPLEADPMAAADHLQQEPPDTVSQLSRLRCRPRIHRLLCGPGVQADDGDARRSGPDGDPGPA